MVGKQGWSMRIGVAAFVAVLCIGVGVARGAFGTDGKVVTDLGGINAADAVAIARGGKIVAAGHSTIDGTFDFAVVRYRKGGKLDNGFGTGGSRIADLGGFDIAHAVLALPNGKIVAGGTSDGGAANDRGTLVRFRKNGGADSSFSGDGIARLNVPGGSGITDMARQHNGKIVVVGVASPGKMLIARFRPGGALDKSFANDGIRKVGIDEFTSANGVALQGKKIVVSGVTSGGQMGDPSRGAFVRLRPNGKLDRSFSKDGRKKVVLPPNGHLNDVAVRNGKIVGAGFVFDIGFKRTVLVRLRKGGGLDRSFAGNGRKVYKFGANSEARSLAFQGKKIVVGGVRADPIADYFVARFKANGRKDRSFAGNGFRTTDFGDGDGIAEIALQRDRKIVAAGEGADAVALARYRKNGALDK